MDEKDVHYDLIPECCKICDHLIKYLGYEWSPGKNDFRCCFLGMTIPEEKKTCERQNKMCNLHN